MLLSEGGREQEALVEGMEGRGPFMFGGGRVGDGQAGGQQGEGRGPLCGGVEGRGPFGPCSSAREGLRLLDNVRPLTSSPPPSPPRSQVRALQGARPVVPSPPRHLVDYVVNPIRFPLSLSHPPSPPQVRALQGARPVVPTSPRRSAAIAQAHPAAPARAAEFRREPRAWRGMLPGSTLRPARPPAAPRRLPVRVCPTSPPPCPS